MKQVPLFIKFFVIIFLFSAVFSAYRCFSMSGMSSISDNDLQGGGKIFKANCSGCHLNGQNLIKPNKPIIGSLKLKSKESFKEFLSSPPPPMPNFKNIVGMQGQFDSLYSYVVSLMGN